ncbi:MAG: Threonylcarbamoyl-AMP synthase, partial [Candidatus Heimdallarchaeota archaeon LC_2]
MKRYSVGNLPLKEIATQLREGAIMLYPTDTIPGIGCLGNNQHAVERLFEIKIRDPSKSVSYAFSSLFQMMSYVEFPKNAWKLSELYPGKLTLVVPRNIESPDLYGIETSSIGCRIPDVDWFLELIKITGTPIVTTSANISGASPVTNIDSIPYELLDNIDILIEWDGDLQGISSTVVDLTEKDEYRILREGGIKEDII